MKEVNYVSQGNEYLRQGVTTIKGILYCTYDLGNNCKVHVGPIVEEKPNCKMQLRCVIVERSIGGISNMERLNLFCNEIEYLIERLKTDDAINVPVEMEAYNGQDIESKESRVDVENECMYNVFEKEETEDD